jgi:hypothetical protein
MEHGCPGEVSLGITIKVEIFRPDQAQKAMGLLLWMPKSAQLPRESMFRF